MTKVWAYRCRLCSEKEICKFPMILFQSMKRTMFWNYLSNASSPQRVLNCAVYLSCNTESYKWPKNVRKSKIIVSTPIPRDRRERRKLAFAKMLNRTHFPCGLNQSSVHLDRNRLGLQVVQIALFHFGSVYRLPGVKKQEIKNHSGLWLRKLFAYRYRYCKEYGQFNKKRKHHRLEALAGLHFLP